MSNSRGPQQLNDGVIQKRIHRERDQFIASINEEDVLRLASSYRGGEACTFFSPTTYNSYKIRGSYNICYFVRFQSSGHKWVVRVPLQPCLGFSVKSKLDSEVATMRLVAKRTTIPLPKIHAYATDATSSPLSAYIILEYIDGKSLSSCRLKKLSDDEKNNLYSSLADIYIQLRRLEFGSIGRLVPLSDGVHVGTKTTSIDMNMQELEGLHPCSIQDAYYKDTGTLMSANSFVSMLLDVANNAFLKGRNSVSEGMGANALYHQHMFRQYVEEKWIDRSLDKGPFVLFHGDLEPFNLMVDDKMTIVAVLDWEWSRVVPVQFFRPPLWLTGLNITTLALQIVYDDYLENAFKEFHSFIRARERECFNDELLANEWEKSKNNGGFLVANALENWTDIDWCANRYINSVAYDGRRDLERRIEEYLQADPLRAFVAERKEMDATVYKSELSRAEEVHFLNEPDGADRGRNSALGKFNVSPRGALQALFTPLYRLGGAIPGSTLGKVAVIAGTSYLIAIRLFGIPFRPKT